MEKKNKIIIACLVILTLLVVGMCIYSVLNKKEENPDTIKFREEYSELNGNYIEQIDKSYVTVNIPDNTKVEYVTEAEAAKLLEKDTGIIYFGFPECPWCRNLVPVLTEVAKEMNETVYYLDILDIRSTFEIKDGKLNKTKEGTKGYYKLLDLMDKELEDFYLEDSEGNKFDTEEKRLYAPTVVAFKKGKITGIHVGTVESQQDPFVELDTEQKEELEKILTKLINSKKDNKVCTNDKC